MGQILDRKGQKFTLVLALDGKLSLKAVSMRDPVVYIEVAVIYKATDDARDPKVLSLTQ